MIISINGLVSVFYCSSPKPLGTKEPYICFFSTLCYSGGYNGFLRYSPVDKYKPSITLTVCSSGGLQRVIVCLLAFLGYCIPNTTGTLCYILPALGEPPPPPPPLPPPSPPHTHCNRSFGPDGLIRVSTENANINDVSMTCDAGRVGSVSVKCEP